MFVSKTTNNIDQKLENRARMKEKYPLRKTKFCLIKLIAAVLIEIIKVLADNNPNVYITVEVQNRNEVEAQDLCYLMVKKISYFIKTLHS